MTRCYISEQIAIHCSQRDEELYTCWHCEKEVEEGTMQEVKTKCSSYQFIGECCIEDYIV